MKIFKNNFPTEEFQKNTEHLASALLFMDGHLNSVF